MAKQNLFDVFFVIFIIGYFRNADSTLLQLSSYTKESVSKCASGGFLDGKDRYVYKGTVNITNIDTSSRRAIIFEMQQASSAVYIAICTFDIYTDTCTGSSLNECYCKSKVNFIVELIMNITADVKYSNGTCRLNWLDPIIGNDTSSENQKVPVIQKNYTELLTIDGHNYNLDSCSAPILQASQIKYCVSELSSHTLRISSDQLIPIEGENCITYNFTSINNLTNFLISVSFIEHNQCQRNDTHFCSLTVTRKSEDNTGAIIGGVVGGLVGLAILTGIIVFVVIRLKKRSSNINNKSNSDEEAPKDSKTNPTTSTVDDK